jgi:hypothetical protein
LQIALYAGPEDDTTIAEFNYGPFATRELAIKNANEIIRLFDFNLDEDVEEPCDENWWKNN